MKIAVDMDGVIANLPKGFVDKYNSMRDFAVNKTVNDIHTYNMDVTFRESGICQKIFRSHNFFYNLEVMPGVIAGLEKLFGDGHEILIVTKLPNEDCGHVQFDKMKWLQEHIFSSIDLTKKDVVFCYGKQWYRGDFMIDDYPDNLLKFDGTRILIDWPYNREKDGNTDEGNKFIRLKQETAWDEIYEMVKKRQVEMTKGIGCL